MIQIGLILFPGSNCERETRLAVQRAGMEACEFLWNEPLAKLAQMDGYILIGGFSYEDRSRAGIIAALDPVMEEIRRQSEEGKPVLGICNGAQILLEAGLVPGLENSHDLALIENKRQRNGKIIGLGFYNAWVKMRLAEGSKPNAFNRDLTTNRIIDLPVAHAEGRFVISEALLAKLQEKGLIAFQYCDEKAALNPDFPVNPNGSVANIAAIANQAGNIMAMMPHPERTANGDGIFISMRDYIEEKRAVTQFRSTINQQSYKPPQVFQKKLDAYECIVSLIITDNHAMTLEKTLRKLGFPVKVNRLIHWEISTESKVALAALKKSELLFCERKEREVSSSEYDSNNSLSYLVRPKDDIIGKKTLDSFETNFKDHQIREIKQGIIWQFSADEGNIHELIPAILQTNIIGNPYAHECYQYQLRP